MGKFKIDFQFSINAFRAFLTFKMIFFIVYLYYFHIQNPLINNYILLLCEIVI